jgi:hypothetical protein
MASAASGGGIREEGYAVTDQGHGFHFDQQRPVVVQQAEVEPPLTVPRLGRHLMHHEARRT